MNSVEGEYHLRRRSSMSGHAGTGDDVTAFCIYLGAHQP